MLSVRAWAPNEHQTKYRVYLSRVSDHKIIPCNNILLTMTLLVDKTSPWIATITSYHIQDAHTTHFDLPAIRCGHQLPRCADSVRMVPVNVWKRHGDGGWLGPWGGQSSHRGGQYLTIISCKQVANAFLQTEYTFVWSLIIASIELSLPVPIHPAIYLTFDLCAWAALVSTLIIYLTLHEPYYTGDGYGCGINGRPDCDGKLVANVEHFGTAMAFLAL